jgi:hypothetical protein
VNRVNASTPMQLQLVARNEFAQFKEEAASMMENKLHIDMKILDYIENHIEPILILRLPPVSTWLILLNLVMMIPYNLGTHKPIHCLARCGGYL